MTGKAKDAEFRHLEAVAFLKSLTDEAAAFAGSSSEMEAVHVAAKFGRSLPQLKAELRAGGVRI